MTTDFDLQGHRGARGLFPENTLHGFEAAISLGVMSIELDVVLTADGVPVVVHDLALNPDIVRRADRQWVRPPVQVVASLQAADLALYDVGRIRPRSRYAARCRGQEPMDGARIPTLRAVTDLAAGSGVRLDVELKTDRRWPDDDPKLARLAEAVLLVLDRPSVAASVRSFDWRVLRLVRRMQPARHVAWLTSVGANANAAAVADAVRQDGWPAWAPVWAPDHRLLRRRHVDGAHALGLLVKPWTVNAAFRMRQLRRWGVDGLCTDRPDIGAQVLGAAAPRP